MSFVNLGEAMRICLAVALSAFLGVTPAIAAEGETLYLKHGCWQCHGTQGQGTIVGPKIAPDPTPYEVFSAFVRMSSRAMPPYREVILSEQDLAKIHEFLRSRPQPTDLRRQFEK